MLVGILGWCFAYMLMFVLLIVFNAVSVLIYVKLLACFDWLVFIGWVGCCLWWCTYCCFWIYLVWVWVLLCVLVLFWFGNVGCLFLVGVCLLWCRVCVS